MTKIKPTIGIIGAGKLGIVLAQLLTRAGYKTLISSADTPKNMQLTINVLAPKATPKTNQDLARLSDVIILALPLSQFKKLPKKELENKLVIDATNHWREVDGERDDIINKDASTSETIQKFLEKSRIVKALNHMGYHNLLDEARAKDHPGRKSIAVAGNQKDDINAVCEIVDDIGFDPLYIGDLSKGALLEAGGPAFGLYVSKKELAKTLGVSVD